MKNVPFMVMLPEELWPAIYKATLIHECTTAELIINALDMFLGTTGTAEQAGWNPAK